MALTVRSTDATRSGDIAISARCAASGADQPLRWRHAPDGAYVIWGGKHWIASGRP